ncbi:unnamed protein product [Rangifer tarandus platyrhynchus]|uniref:Uncharacterized protein n=1 Tax=Rangifer tarandus platyrhynchus TaxID=3082113 RepID=A0AC59YB72_RANTA
MTGLCHLLAKGYSINSITKDIFNSFSSLIFLLLSPDLVSSVASVPRFLLCFFVCLFVIRQSVLHSSNGQDSFQRTRLVPISLCLKPFSDFPLVQDEFKLLSII